MENKRCYKCKKQKGRDEFHKDSSRKSGLGNKCKICSNDPELLRIRRRKRKVNVMNHYGDKCNCCGITDIEFLTIDHINNDRYKYKIHSGIATYLWLIRNNFPPGFQVLCFNCNFKKELKHKKEEHKHTKYSERNTIRRSKLKVKIFSHYGSKCKCCGQSEIDVLTINHINNNGAEHRKEIKLSCVDKFYYWIIKNNFPDDLQVLCWNCNLGRQFHDGICPHIIGGQK